ncbi:hypothetical protein [Nitrospira sp.]
MPPNVIDVIYYQVLKNERDQNKGRSEGAPNIPCLSGGVVQEGA